MAEIENCLEKMINYELREASNYATRSTIKLRALMRIINMLGLSLSLIYETKNLIRIDVSCSCFIEKLWKKYYGESSSSNTIATTISSPTSEEWATLERFLAKDFVRNVDLIRLAGVLKKRLPEKDLNFIFAVDGLDNFKDNNNNSRDNNVIIGNSSSNNNNNCVGENINNLRNYFENLSVPIRFERDEDVLEKLEWIHVYTIRMIYKRLGENCTPEKIGKVLKKLFGLNFNTATTTTTTTTTTTHTTATATSHTANVNETAVLKIDKNADDDDNKKIYSSSSSDDDDDDDDDDDENDIGGVQVKEDIIEKNIETLYKNNVGNKLLDIASWKKMEVEKVLMKEMNRKRKSTTPITTNTTDTNNLPLKENDVEVRNKPGRPRIKDSFKKKKSCLPISM